MQIIFDISSVIAVIYLIIRIFSRSLPQKLDHYERSKLLRIVYIGIIFKIGLILVWYLYAGGLEVNPSVSDIVDYDRGGLDIADRLRSGILYTPNITFSTGSDNYLGYYYFVGIIYALFGHFHIIVSIFNGLASICIALLMYHVAASIFDHKIAKLTLIFNLFYPQFISASYFILKDIMITFLVAAIAWSLSKKQRFTSFILTITLLVILLFFRMPLAIIIGVLIIFHYTFSQISISRGFIKSFVLPSLAATLFIIVITQVKLGEKTALSRFGYTTNIQAYHTESPGFLEEERVSMDIQGFLHVADKIIDYPSTFIHYTLESIFHIFWGPPYLYSRSGPTLHPYFPNETIFRSLLESLSGLFTAFLIPMILYGGIYSFKFRKKETFLFYSFIILMTLTLIFTGNVFRWRLPIMPFVLMFGAVGCMNFFIIKPFYIIYILMFNLLVAANATLHHNLTVAIPLFFLTFCGLLWGFFRYRQSLI